MNIGMLWFDNDPKAELNTKVERAATYYQHKYGKAPTLCFVHPTMLPKEIIEASSTTQNQSIKSGGVEIRPNRSVLPNHLWIGVNGINHSAD